MMYNNALQEALQQLNNIENRKPLKEDIGNIKYPKNDYEVYKVSDENPTKYVVIEQDVNPDSTSKENTILRYVICDSKEDATKIGADWAKAKNIPDVSDDWPAWAKEIKDEDGKYSRSIGVTVLKADDSQTKKLGRVASFVNEIQQKLKSKGVNSETEELQVNDNDEGAMSYGNILLSTLKDNANIKLDFLLKITFLNGELQPFRLVSDSHNLTTDNHILDRVIKAKSMPSILRNISTSDGAVEAILYCYKLVEEKIASGSDFKPMKFSEFLNKYKVEADPIRVIPCDSDGHVIGKGWADDGDSWKEVLNDLGMDFDVIDGRLHNIPKRLYDIYVKNVPSDFEEKFQEWVKKGADEKIRKAAVWPA